MRYAKYKPTGIAWLPEVPEGWEVRRARYLFKKEQRPTCEGALVDHIIVTEKSHYSFADDGILSKEDVGVS